MVTDFDCWHPEHDAVTVDQVVKVLLSNADKAKALVKALIPAIGQPRGLCPAGCDRALEYAIITAPEKRDPALIERVSGAWGAQAIVVAIDARRVSGPRRIS
jgi:5'-methylthioadenosine phosphorylase